MNQVFLHNIQAEHSKQSKLFFKQGDNFSFVVLLVVIIFLQKTLKYTQFIIFKIIYT